MSRLGCALLSAATIALCAPASSAQTTAIARRLGAAQAAEAAGDYRGALQEYRVGLDPSTEGTPEQRAQISLSFAHLLATLETGPLTTLPEFGNDTWDAIAPAGRPSVVKPTSEGGGGGGGGGGSSKSRPDLMRRLYDIAIQAGTPAQQNLGRNDLGTLLLQENRNADALDVLRRIDLNRDPARRFVYQYNVGRAWEVNRRPAEALTAYLGAVTARPAFTSAVDAALSLLENAARLDANAAVTLTTVLLSNGEIRPAARVTSRLLSRWAGDAAAPRLLAMRLRWLVAASIDLPTCRSQEVPLLDRLRASAELRALVQDVKRVCLDEALPDRLQIGDRSGLASQWMAGQRPIRDALDYPRASFAAFVTAVGRQFEERENYGQALARYMAAWTLDKGNAESAVNAAMLLQAHPDVDRTGGALDALIENIFAAKGDFIAERDWPNSQRLHIVLARIFEKLDRWGPVDNPRSALYQWTAAIEDDAEIRKQDRSHARSPGLYERLGHCYQSARQPNLAAAAAQYRRAAQEFAAVGREEDAARLRRLAEDMSRPR